MIFASRAEAGRLLGEYLQSRKVRVDLVLGLPRGGVIVAAEVVRALDVPLDVLVVRKIGHPQQREFAVGALAEPDVALLDRAVIRAEPALHRALQEIIRDEQECLHQQQQLYRPGGPLPLAGKAVLVADDGLATGATSEAAVLAARKLKATSVAVAAPVASGDAVRRLGHVANDLFVLEVDEELEAVGCYYAVFEQATDEEVLAALRPYRTAE